MTTRNRRHEPWQTEQRYYCATCNAWMGNDRQSILLHENGKKHREKLELTMQERRMKKQRDEKQQKFLTVSLQQMEQAAETGAHTYSHKQQSVKSTQSSNNHNVYPQPTLNEINSNHRTRQGRQFAIGRSVISSLLPVESSPHEQAAIVYHRNRPTHNNNPLLEQEKKDWQAQKIKREEKSVRKRKERDGDDGERDEAHSTPSNTHPKVTILPGEGYYSYNDMGENDTKTVIDTREKEKAKEGNATIYLEGDVFFGLLEEEMPVQVWLGSSCCRTEKRQSKNMRNWKNALIVRVVNHRSDSTNEQYDEPHKASVNVSYLSTLDQKEETIERKISLNRIRIILGADEKIPDTLEEARLLAMGGEEFHYKRTLNGNDKRAMDQKQEVNEATGLSGWQTVHVKKTTHRQQHRDERKRYEESKLLASKIRETEQKRIAERRLEESRACNADDSALGAFDVFGKMNYKGVDISKEVHSSVEDSSKRIGTAKKTTQGVKVTFKKRLKKKAQRATRRTSADDDD